MQTKIKKTITINKEVSALVVKWGKSERLNYSAALEAIVSKFLGLDEDPQVASLRKEVESLQKFIAERSGGY